MPKCWPIAKWPQLHPKNVKSIHYSIQNIASGNDILTSESQIWNDNVDTSSHPVNNIHKTRRGQLLAIHFFVFFGVKCGHGYNINLWWIEFGVVVFFNQSGACLTYLEGF
jgi:hypothetical protein